MQYLLVLFILSQSPSETDPVRIVADAGLKLYKALISPSQGDVCNFSPSCSQFARQSIEKYGIIWGALMASDRLQRCNPWAYQYYGTYYPEMKDHKLHDPIENNYILRPHMQRHSSDGAPREN